jgi:fused signal recognition particle receptor
MTLHLPEVVGAVTAGIAGSLAYVRMRQQIAAKAKRVADTTTHEEPQHSVVDAVVAPHAAVATPSPEVAAPATPSDVPAPTKGRMRGLVERLGRSNSVFGGALMTLLSSESGAQTDWESVEDTLILADLGARPSQELVERLRRKVDAKAGVDAIRGVVRDELLSMVDVSQSR